MPLNGKQRRQLRALGHHLHAVVIVGQSGITPGIISATDQALFDHELVKVKLPEGRDDRLEWARSLATQTDSEVAQILGRTVLLFRARPEDSKIQLVR